MTISFSFKLSSTTLKRGFLSPKLKMTATAIFLVDRDATDTKRINVKLSTGVKAPIL